MINQMTGLNIFVLEVFANNGPLFSEQDYIAYRSIIQTHGGTYRGSHYKIFDRSTYRWITHFGSNDDLTSAATALKNAGLSVHFTVKEVDILKSTI